MKNLPVATFILNNILKNIEISNKIDVVDVSLGSDTAKMIISGISQSEFVQLVLQRMYNKMDFELDNIDLSATFEIYGFQLKVYAESRNSIELIFKIPYSGENCVKDSLRRAIFKVIKENHDPDIDLNEITLLKSSLDAITYGVSSDNMKSFVNKISSESCIIDTKWCDDHKGREYRITTIDLGLFSIVVNNNEEIHDEITVLL